MSMENVPILTQPARVSDIFWVCCICGVLYILKGVLVWSSFTVVNVSLQYFLSPSHKQ